MSSIACRPASRGIRPKAGRRARPSTRCTGPKRNTASLPPGPSRLVPEGFHPTWSPDGAELAYSRGVLGASGIEIRNLATGKTRLLAMPGKDPAWSPDGRYIAYVRDRQVLPITDLATEHQGDHRPFEQEEIWIIRVDGTETPRFLATGGWPNWNRDSNRVYYHSRTANKLCCVSTDPNDVQQREIRGSMDYFPVVSPDEKYVTNMHEGSTLQILDLATGAIVASWPGPARTPATVHSLVPRQSFPEHRMLLGRRTVDL